MSKLFGMCHRQWQGILFVLYCTVSQLLLMLYTGIPYNFPTLLQHCSMATELASVYNIKSPALGLNWGKDRKGAIDRWFLGIY